MMSKGEPKLTQHLVQYTPEEQKMLERYYGAPLALLAGIEFVRNAECRLFLAELTESTADLTTC